MAAQTARPGAGPPSQYAFFDGRIVQFENAKVSVLTHAFNYGTAVFEGIRGYWNERVEELYIVRLREHMDRLRANCRILKLDPRRTTSELSQLCVELVRRNQFRSDCYVRPIVYCSAQKIGPAVNEDQSLTMFVVPMGHYHDPGRPLNVMVSSWRRTDDNAIPPRGKINGSYVNSCLAIMEAHDSGFDDAVLLNQDGHVSEGSVMNIFVKRGGVLVTPPATANILEGITRADLIRLSREELGIEVVERVIDRTELYQADEIFLCGTGARILAVGSVDRRTVGDGTTGPVTLGLLDLYDRIVRGDDDRHREWLTPVYGGG